MSAHPRHRLGGISFGLALASLLTVPAIFLAALAADVVTAFHGPPLLWIQPIAASSAW